MIKLNLISGTTRVASAMRQAINDTTGEPAKAAIVSWTDGTESLVSLKEFNGDFTPKFLNADLSLANGYEVRQGWIQKSTSSVKLR